MIIKYKPIIKKKDEYKQDKIALLAKTNWDYIKDLSRS